jgi:hypothetical protein
MSVIYSGLPVHGLDGLRVIDASVMPALTSTKHLRADHHDRHEGPGDD